MREMLIHGPSTSAQPTNTRSRPCTSRISCASPCEHIRIAPASRQTSHNTPTARTTSVPCSRLKQSTSDLHSRLSLRVVERTCHGTESKAKRDMDGGTEQRNHKSELTHEAVLKPAVRIRCSLLAQPCRRVLNGSIPDLVLRHPEPVRFVHRKRLCRIPFGGHGGTVGVHPGLETFLQQVKPSHAKDKPSTFRLKREAQVHTRRASANREATLSGQGVLHARRVYVP